MLPAKYEDLAVETGCIKIKFYLKKLLLKPIALVYLSKDGLRLFLFENLKLETKLLF